MSPKLSKPESRPLNPRQRAFARELGIELAQGKRSFEDAYERAGFRRHRGNAARLAANDQVRAIAEQECTKALRLAGVHIGYLQAKALQLLECNALQIRRALVMNGLDRDPKTGLLSDRVLTEEQELQLYSDTWAASEVKISADGSVTVKVPDKKGVIEMLAKMLGSMPDPTADAIGGLGERLDRAIQRISQGA
jgi:hypothetical protein